MNRFFIFLLLILLPALGFAQTCKCCQKRDAGQAAYDRKEYKTALIRWQEGLKLADAAQCPDLKDLVANAKIKVSAPDRDKDSVPDTEDICPDDAGEPEWDGCLIVALDDYAPKKAAKTNSLPRTVPDDDSDGIANQKDNCPNLPGLAINHGCPQPIIPNSKPIIRLAKEVQPANMVLVKGGTFTMGDLFNENKFVESQHTVTVSDFYIAKTEVTFDDYDAYCDAIHRPKVSDKDWRRGQHPVIKVSWYDAVAYCNWLSEQRGRIPAYIINTKHKDPANSSRIDYQKWTVTRNLQADGYRLPTEAEWEYAARQGGQKVRFGNGKDKADPIQINLTVDKRLQEPYALAGESPQKTVEVGSLHQPNALGLHDMSGNVLEWCGDWLADYPDRLQTNPTGSISGQFRVLRGGGWDYAPTYCRTSFRSRLSPIAFASDVGFRIAASYQKYVPPCLCCQKRDAGQLAYDRKDYKTALNYWREGLKLADAATLCPKMENLVNNAIDQLYILFPPPDVDKDGVPDSLDVCPDTTGLKNNWGCPLGILSDSIKTALEGMVLVQGGTFIMGDLFGENEEDTILHRVTLSNFYLAATEVTFEDFNAFQAATGLPETPCERGDEKHPYSNTDWYDAVAYCNWLSEQRGRTPAYTIDKINKDPYNLNKDWEDPKKWTVSRNPGANGYRLPTEAEWEYAAREGGKKVRFGTGENIADPAQMNFYGMSSFPPFYAYAVADKGLGFMVAVGSLHHPNALGLHDMSGNASEWCADWYAAYPVQAESNPTGLLEGQYRVSRGGSYELNAESNRVAFRGRHSPTCSWATIGFRLARSY